MRFLIDREEVLKTRTSPTGPLGLVIWMDNQAMVFRPWGRMSHRHEVVTIHQGLQVRDLVVEKIPR